jgi:hypothetical protein
MEMKIVPAKPMGTKRPTEDAATKRAAKWEDGKREFKGWVNISLPNDAKAKFFAWCEGQKLDDLISRVLVGEYRLSLYRDEYNDCMAASLTCWNRSTDQYGYSLSMRGDDGLTAMWRVLYVHFEFTQENWGAWMVKPTHSDW